MKHPRCSNCGEYYPLEHLTIDGDTMDYLCPSCYSEKKSRNEDLEITSVLFFIIVVTVVIAIFCLWTNY